MVAVKCFPNTGATVSKVTLNSQSTEERAVQLLFPVRANKPRQNVFSLNFLAFSFTPSYCGSPILINDSMIGFIY